MDDHNEMYEIGLTAPMEMAEEYRLDEMLPMMGLKIGKRCISLCYLAMSVLQSGFLAFIPAVQRRLAGIS